MTFILHHLFRLRTDYSSSDHKIANEILRLLLDEITKAKEDKNFDNQLTKMVKEMNKEKMPYIEPMNKTEMFAVKPENKIWINNFKKSISNHLDPSDYNDLKLRSMKHKARKLLFKSLTAENMSTSVNHPGIRR